MTLTFVKVVGFQIPFGGRHFESMDWRQLEGKGSYQWIILWV